MNQRELLKHFSAKMGTPSHRGTCVPSPCKLAMDEFHDSRKNRAMSPGGLMGQASEFQGVLGASHGISGHSSSLRDGMSIEGEESKVTRTKT